MNKSRDSRTSLDRYRKKDAAIESEIKPYSKVNDEVNDWVNNKVNDEVNDLLNYLRIHPDYTVAQFAERIGSSRKGYWKVN